MNEDIEVGDFWAYGGSEVSFSVVLRSALRDGRMVSDHTLKIYISRERPFKVKNMTIHADRGKSFYNIGVNFAKVLIDDERN